MPRKEIRSTNRHFDQTSLVLRDEVWLAALDELASTVVAVMVLFTVMNVTIFLVPG
jgi:hypothetical protein